MFFRPKVKEEKDKDRLQQPIVGKDGNLYVEEGQEYDSDQYETDSDYEEEEDGLEYENENEEEEEDDDDDKDEGEHGKENVKIDFLDVNTNSTVVGYTKDRNDRKELQEERMIKYNDIHDNDIHDNEQQQNDQQRHNQKENDTLISSTSEVEEEEEVVVINSEEQKEQEEQNLSTTLIEKRSLLALAAQHDRVDIIKTILQSSHHHSNNNVNNNTQDQQHQQQLIQLLLNNKIKSLTKSNKSFFTKSDIAQVFLPPLHIAIASSSTNAASCLLRMGADPSIRPYIPDSWNGPEWDDLSSDKNSNGSPRHNNTNNNKDFWKKLNNLTAWEIAFGYDESEHEKIISKNSKTANNSSDDDKKQKEKQLTSAAATKTTTTSSWFIRSWASSKDSDGDNDKYHDNPPYNITPSKLEGIKHAFTAEALRSIGSDEVNRLRELLNSGICNNDRNISNGNGDDRGGGIEIGGKSLMGWCIEMNAKRCTELLKEMYPPTKSIDNNDTKKKDDTSKTENTIEKVDPTECQKVEENTFEEDLSQDMLLNLEIKVEENRVLSASLSLVLDNLAEEVSLTQGLLYQQGDSTNSALISQVRTLKERRSGIESEISEWEGRLADRIVELRLVLGWWKRKGGSDNDFAEIFDGNNAGMYESIQSISQSMSTTMKKSNNLDPKTLKSRIMEAKAQVTLSEGKVEKLRSSIADLAEENSRNLIEVTKRGLGGAVNLARKLKDEVKEMEFILQNLKEREAACRTRVCMIRTQLERLSSTVAIAEKAKNPCMPEDTTTDVPNDSENEIDNTISEVQEELQDDQVESQEPVLYYDEEDDCLIEYVDNSDGSDIEYEYYSDSDGDSEDYEDIPLSEAIKIGKSTALVVREEPHQFLSFKIWELLMRMIGLSKKAIKKTVEEHGLHDIGNLPRAMIV